MSRSKLIKRILLIVGLGTILFISRGTPKNEINLPELIKLNAPVKTGEGRPIPYHEVLVGYRNWFDFYVIVYNDLNNVLSDETFVSLREEDIKKETKADIVIKNGPRFWVLDEIHGKSKSPVWTLQGHQYIVPAYLKLNLLDLLNRKPYQPMGVTRDTKYVYYNGTLVYKLISPAGDEYIMQAASQEIDPNIELADLAMLGERLTLNEGWEYEVEKLTSTFTLTSNGATEIVQDDFRNTYQLIR